MNVEKLLEMFKMQEELNIYIAGNDWKSGITKTGNEINWLRCARFELVEAIDQSFQWKHWKNNLEISQYDIINKENLKIEIVDVYHFIMSELLAQNYEAINNIAKLAIVIDTIKPFKFSKNRQLVKQIEKFEYFIFKYEYKKIKDFESLTMLFKDFWELALSVMSFEELYRMYILKNVLNLFRQKHGYQNGTYIKNWGKDKIEDNVFLDKYIQTGGKIEFELIYNYLEKNYQELNQGM